MTYQVSGSGRSAPARFSAGNPLLSRLVPMMPVTGGAMRRFAEISGESEPLSGTLGRLGSLEVRLARTPREIWRAQRLRYRVFYQEMSAKPDVVARVFRRDADRFDQACDHLLVIDHEAKGRFGGTKPKVVGTYRLMRKSAADRLGGFYSQSEFDLQPLLARHPGQRFLELGRSCVLKPYRTKRTVDLLWSGIWAYIRHHRIDAMFGCASFDGTDPDALALPLSFLHHQARSEGDWLAEAHAHRRVDMDRLPAGTIDVKMAVRQMPPLIKGYLRLGARFGTGAVVDRQFGTTDVLVVLPVAAIDKRYIEYYGGETPRYAA